MPTLPIPPINQSLLIRTDYADDVAWTTFREFLERTLDGGPEVELMWADDRAYDGLTPEALGELITEDDDLTFAFLADAVTLSADGEHTIVVVDLYDEPGRSFRVVPIEFPTVQANLETANLDYDDFADDVDPAGVYRGR